MKKPVLFLAIIAIALPTFAAHPAKPGKWEMTSEFDMPGMTMKMPPQTHTVCITKEDLEKNPESFVPKPTRRGGEERTDCKLSDLKTEGATTSWTVNCGGERPMTGNGKITYTSESYTGNMDMKMGDREVKIKYSGKYLGPDCDKK